MKNQSFIIITAIASILFISCKKDYTCTCTSTTVQTTGMGSYQQTIGESSQKFSKVSKKYAREHCSSGTDVQTTGSGINEVKVDRIWNCQLK